MLFLLLFVVSTVQGDESASPEQAFIGVYEAEHVIDTVERITLKSDSRFSFLFTVLFSEDSAHEGRWALRKDSIVLIAQDTEGRDIEFPLEVVRRQNRISLVYSEESYATAKAKMILPNSFIRLLTEPNQSASTIKSADLSAEASAKEKATAKGN